MAAPKEDLAKAAAGIGYTVPESDADEYAALLAKARETFEAVEAMEDCQPTPDLTLTPRQNIHFPSPASNPLNAWAWRCTITHLRPPSRQVANRTLCLKDNMALAGVPCLLGTSSLTGGDDNPWTPIVDATAAARALAAGATIAGKAVCENLSRGAVSATAATGPVHNPWARGYSAGGSSSGTAALVAAGQVDLGLGCDQGGSVRIPAALCGLYGMKPTFGLVPYTGIASNDASVDYVGPMTRTCEDCAALLEVVAGVDGLDDRQGAGCPFPGEVPAYAAELAAGEAEGVKGMRIGILKEGVESADLDAGLRAKFEAATRELARLGAEVVEVSVPAHGSARLVYAALSKLGNHMGMLGRATGRRQLMLTDLLERKGLPYTQDALDRMSVFSREGLLAGELGWADFPRLHAKAVNLSRKLRDDYDAVLRDVDVLIMPTTLRPAAPLPSPTASPLEHMAAGRGLTENTSPFNASGHPALAVPIGFVSSREDPEVRVPASLQVVGRFWAESTLFRVAYAWERAVDWKTF